MAGVKSHMLVFDMDGVLVDVTGSYRAAIVETVRHFTGEVIPQSLIQDYKNRGGWNNDWSLSQRLIADMSGRDLLYGTVVEAFQGYFFGVDLAAKLNVPISGGPFPAEGLVLKEQWIPKEGLMESLASRFSLSIFTGRSLAEAEFTLTRFVPRIRWSCIAADDNVEHSKPAPDGLLDIAAKFPGTDLLYFGDTVDDARSARAAGVRFVGVAHAANTRRDELVSLLKAEGAVAIIENFNQIEEVL